MSISSERIIQILYKRLIGGKLTADESRMLDDWTDENPETRRKLVKDLYELKGVANDYRLRERISSDKAYSDMCRRLGIEEEKAEEERSDVAKRIRPTRKEVAILKYAAVAAAVAAIPAMLYFAFTTTDKPLTAQGNVEADRQATHRAVTLEQLSPGSTCAVMTLPGGDTIRLSEPDGIPANATAGLSEGKLSLEVPRGGEFAIMLEDSTKVWLNSESRLYYPAHFSSSERNVELTGEAYFEVTHNSDRPFTVETSGQKVTVYGTEFNIRSYPEEKSVYTTLSKGSIGLSRAKGDGGEIRLSPGKQAVFDKETSSARVRKVDIKRVTGWRHGRFVFEEQSLRQIMTDLSRWYDFEFEFADAEAAETIFMGSIPRYSNFKTAIAILEKSGGLVFSVKDNKVVISKE